MIKDIFLVDAVNTILDFHASSLLSLKKSFEKFGVEWREEYGTEFTRFNDYLWERLERKEITRDELLSIRFPQYLKILGIDTVDGEEFNRVFLHTLSLTPVYIEGAQEFLKTLRKNGRVFIVTNGTTNIQKSRFEICGLNELVDGVFVSETIGYNKPAKEYTDYVLTHFDGFSKERAVWIGDSLSADIKAAKDANITCIWYNPDKKGVKEDEKPDFYVDNFDKILRILGI